MNGIPGKRRIRDAISSDLLHDYDRFAVEATNWSGATAIVCEAVAPDGTPFTFRVQITDVEPSR